MPFALVLAVIVSAPTAAPDLSPLAECRLAFATAKARLKAMRPTGSQNKSDAEVTWIVTSYDPGVMRPLGFKATGFEHELWSEEDGEVQTLTTTLDAGLATVQAKMLVSRRMSHCLQPFAAPIPNQCMIAPGNDATGTPGIWIKEQYGKARIECRYTPPG
jgi:hypothetical protein